MKTIRAHSVHEALQGGMLLLRDEGVARDSRNGLTIEHPSPITTTYLMPWQRVLTDPVRNANPFFHFFEALWILAGREDVAWLAQFNGNMVRYSDDNKTFHAPYGHRLVHAPKGKGTNNQLEHVINMIRKDPDTRRAVLQIWDHTRDLNVNSKDLPCNAMVFLRCRADALDMTVCNRSNDIVWGAYGANAVQFSILLEYLAARTFKLMGHYHQISNSFHVYVDNPYWQEWQGPRWDLDPYEDAAHPVERFPLFTAPEVIDIELTAMFETWEESHRVTIAPDWLYRNAGLMFVAVPMYHAWRAYKNGDYGVALRSARAIAAKDWQRACVEWLQRAIDRKVKGTSIGGSSE
jgi:hypothetical protein